MIVKSYYFKRFIFRSKYGKIFVEIFIIKFVVYFQFVFYGVVIDFRLEESGG